MASPIAFIADTTSSKGMALRMPAARMQAAVRALAAMKPLRFTQGTSTRPATGSQASPRQFLSERAAASNTASGSGAISQYRAPAAMAAAEPHSAWQPPEAPATEAFIAMIDPMAEATMKASWNRVSEGPNEGSRASRHAHSTPGTMPQEPAVGKATMRPPQAFTSFTARE